MKLLTLHQAEYKILLPHSANHLTQEVKKIAIQFSLLSGMGLMLFVNIKVELTPSPGFLRLLPKRPGRNKQHGDRKELPIQK